jgi:hypothetical protein
MSGAVFTLTLFITTMPATHRYGSNSNINPAPFLPWVAMSVITALAGCAPAPPYSPALLQQWHQSKADLGPTFAGSPTWHAHMADVEAALDTAGVVAIERYPAPYTRWWAADKPTAAERALGIDGKALPVASYWAYSGSTPAGGVTAPLLVYKKGMARDLLRDRIVVFQVEPVPAAMSKMFKIGHEYATADFVVAAPGIADDQWYQGNYVTRFGRWDAVLKDSGAAGAIVVFSMSFDRLAGLYTFPLLNLGIVGVPGIYVDQDVGAEVLAAAEEGQSAALTLIAHQAPAEPYFYSAVLPGKHYGTDDDAQVLLVTHSDGPNLSQENGALGIAALLRHYARVPQSDRPRSLRVLLDPQHYTPGRHTLNWYDAHPEIMRQVVASIGVEQLGQREYGDGVGDDAGDDVGVDAGGYGLTGRAEPWQIFVRDDPRLIRLAIDAINTSGVPRTELRVPERKGQGRWTGLGEVAIERDLPGFGTLSGMSGYWGTTAGIESFDAELASRQLDLLVLLIDGL